ncbi:MAG: helix-turn-helix domain-containing protein, partial [Sphingomonadales bacterium]
GWPGNVRELRNLVERAAILFPDEAIGAEQVGLLLLCRLRSPKPQTPAPSPSNPPSVSAAIDDAAPPPSAAPAVAKSSAAFHGGPIDLRKLMAEVEYRYVTEALRASEGVVADAARLLSLQRTTLIEKMRKLGLARAA